MPRPETRSPSLSRTTSQRWISGPQSARPWSTPRRGPRSTHGEIGVRGDTTVSSPDRAQRPRCDHPGGSPAAIHGHLSPPPPRPTEISSSGTDDRSIGRRCRSPMLRSHREGPPACATTRRPTGLPLSGDGYPTRAGRPTRHGRPLPLAGSFGSPKNHASSMVRGPNRPPTPHRGQICRTKGAPPQCRAGSRGAPRRRTSPTRLLIAGAGVVVLLLVAASLFHYLKASTSGQTGITGAVIGFAPDGTLVTAGERGPGVRFWNTKSGQESRSPLTFVYSGQATLSKDGQTLAVASAGCASHVAPCPQELSEAGGPGSRVRLYSTTTGQQTCVIEQSNDSPYHIVFAPDGKTVALDGFQAAASLWDANSCQQFARLKSPTMPT